MTRDLLESNRKPKPRSAHAKTLYTRDLRWLVGFPDRASDGQIRWVSVCWEQSGSGHRGHDVLVPLRLDRERLRVTDLAASKLRHGPHSELEKVVPNPDRWFRQYDRRMSALKTIVHQVGSVETVRSELIGTSTTRRLQRRWGRLSRQHETLASFFVNVQSSLRLCRRPRETMILDWLEFSAPLLEKIAVFEKEEHENINAEQHALPDHSLFAITLLSESITRRDQLQGIVNLLTSHGLARLNLDVPAEHVRGQVRDRRSQLEQCASQQTMRALNRDRQRDAFVAADRSLRFKLGGQLQSAARLNRSARQALVHRLTVLGSPKTLVLIDRHCSRLVDETEYLDRFQRRLSAALHLPHQNRPLVRELELDMMRRSKLTPVPNAALARRFSKVCDLFRHWPVELVNAASGWLEAMCEYPSASLELLCQMADSSGWAIKGRRLTRFRIEVLQALTQMVRKHGATKRFILLLDQVLAEPSRWFQLSLWRPWKVQDTEDLKKHSLSEFHCFLESLVFQHTCPIKGCVTASLGDLFQVVHDAKEASEIVTALCAADLQYRIYASDITTLSPFADTPEQLAELVVAEQQLSLDTCLLAELVPLSQRRHTRRMIRQWIVRGNESELNEIARLAKTVESLGKSVQPMDAITPPTSWLSKYPCELQSTLADLAEVSPDADSIAKRVLSHDLVDVQKHRAELDYLQRQLKQPSVDEAMRRKLARRRQVVAYQLGHPRPVSPGRMKTLQGKLQQRVARECFCQLKYSLTESVAESLSDRSLYSLERDSIHRIVGDRNLLDIVIGISEIDQEMQPLGADLLRRTLNGQPCPGTEHPKNAAFIDNLSRQGINASAWLNSTGVLRYTTASGKDVTLEISRDPLDYFLMGHHFDTCLAPDSFNFFSTIANAVDINKHVLYARDETGRVQGRCLIALSGRGEIVAFHHYAHSDRNEFRDAVRRFCQSLAQQMGTRTVAKAKIKRLVSPRWYDDGTVDPVAYYHSDSIDPFRELLSVVAGQSKPTDIAIETLRQSVRGFLKNASGNDILRHVPPLSRPLHHEAVHALLSECDLRSLDPMLCLRVALWAARTGDSKWLCRVLEWMGPRTLVRRFAKWRSDDDSNPVASILGDESNVTQFFNHIAPETGLKILRATRARGVRSDTEETSPQRRRLLASLHQRLGRTRLPGRLVSTPKRQSTAIKEPAI